MHDLAEHTTTLLTIIGGLIAIIGAVIAVVGRIFWQLIVDIRDRVKSLTEIQTDFSRMLGKFIDNCHANHLALIDQFPTRKEWEEWQKGRAEIKQEQVIMWDALNEHSHSADGKTVRAK